MNYMVLFCFTSIKKKSQFLAAKMEATYNKKWHVQVRKGKGKKGMVN